MMRHSMPGRLSLLKQEGPPAASSTPDHAPQPALAPHILPGQEGSASFSNLRLSRMLVWVVWFGFIQYSKPQPGCISEPPRGFYNHHSRF